MVSIYEQTWKTKSTAQEPRPHCFFQGLTKPLILRKLPHSCYGYNKEPLPIERFLGIAYKKHGRGLWKSTRTIGITLFYMLREGPKIVNISQLARDTGYSRPVVYAALAYFSRFGKVQRINEKHTGKRRPCEYKLHSSFTEKQEPAKPQEKARCGVSVNRIRSLESKINHTTKKSSFSLESYKNMPKTFPLMPRDRKKLLAIARDTCQPGTVSPVLDVLYRRDPVAGVWLDAIRGLQGVMIDAQPEEVLWRSRKAVVGLVGGLNEDGFRAIMLDQPANEEEATKRDVAEIDRRLRGLEKWGARHGCTSWYVEKRAELEKERYRTDLPCGICTDGFFTTINEPQPQPRRPRGRVFHVGEYYRGSRKPLEGEVLEEKRASLVKRLWASALQEQEAIIYEQDRSTYGGG